MGDSEPNFLGEKVGEFHNIKFVGDSELNFRGTSGGENLGSFTA